jgi:hypothetical protein
MPIGYLNGTSLNLNCVGFALNVPVPNPKANWAQARSATAAAELQSSTLVTCQSWMPIIKPKWLWVKTSCTLVNIKMAGIYGW